MFALAEACEEEDAEEAEQEQESLLTTDDSEPSDSTNLPPSPIDQELSLRFRMLVQSTASRLARRIAKKGSIGLKEIELIAQSFGFDHAYVSMWAEQQAQPLLEKPLTDSLIQFGLNQ